MANALNKVALKGLNDGTDGQIITYDANGNPVAVGPGTDGQVLTSTGAGSPPAFEDIPAKAALTGSTNNQITTVTGANAIQGETNLTFDGSKITVGTSATKTNLNSSADAGGQVAQFVGAADNTNHCLGLFAYSGSTNPGSRGAKFQLNRARSSDGSTNTVLSTNDLIGSIEWKGNDGTSFTSAARIDAYVDAGTGTDDMPGRLVFYTSADGSHAPTERMRIDSSGYVRIASTTESADGAFNDLIIGNHSGNRGISILSTNGQQGAIGFAKSGALSDGYLAYNHNSTATSSSMILKSSGNIMLDAAGATSLKIDANGEVTKPKQPSASAYFSGNDAGGGGGKISNDYALASNTRWNIGSHYSTSTGKFTCPVAGKYAVTFSSNMSLSNLSVGDNYNIQTRVNGSTVQFNYDSIYNVSWQHIGFTNILDCAANDYIQLFYASQGNKTFGADHSNQWNQIHFYLLH